MVDSFFTIGHTTGVTIINFAKITKYSPTGTDQITFTELTTNTILTFVDKAERDLVITNLEKMLSAVCINTISPQGDASTCLQENL